MGRGKPRTTGCANGPRTAPGTTLQASIVKDDAVGEVEWVIAIDSTVVRARQHAAGARETGIHTRFVRGPPSGRRMPQPIPRGLSTKLHQASSCPRRARPADERGPHCRPRRRQPATHSTADQIRVPRPGPGRPRSKPEAVLADTAYSHSLTRASVQARRIRFTSRTFGSDRPTSAQGLPRRTTACPGPVRVLKPQRRRTMLQQTHTIPRLRHPLRQTSRHYRAEIFIAATNPGSDDSQDGLSRGARPGAEPARSPTPDGSR
jgi:hypothetical protein